MGTHTRSWATWLVAATVTLQLWAFAPTAVSADVLIAESRLPPSVGRSDPITRGSSGVWDPNDVKGRFDLRWVGAAYTSTGEIHLSVSFYDGFDWRLLPTDPTDLDSNVNVWLSGALNGYFLRRPGGRLVFLWGDFGSSCCAPKARVTRPSSDVLSVVFDPCSYGYGEEIYEAKGESLWVTRNVEAEDWTGAVELDHPQCDTSTQLWR